MAEGDAVFAFDGAHVGQLTGLDEDWLTVRGDGCTYRVPRREVAYEHGRRVFLATPNRGAARLWRVDVEGARGVRAWWERRVLALAQRPLGGRLED